jgi:Tfp pilus assembly protein FimT
MNFHWHRRRATGRSGATLIDLVITVLVMGILAAVAAPRFASALARLQAEAGARRVAGDLNYARRVAIQTSRQTTVAFRTSPAGYDMTAVDDPAYPGQAYSVDLSAVGAGLALQSAVFNGGATIHYNAYGRPLVGGAALTTGTVVVSVGGQTRSVIVNVDTGEATVP